MRATYNSGRFVQFASLAKAFKGTFSQFMYKIASDHGEIFDFVSKNYELCRDWWENERPCGKA